MYYEGNNEGKSVVAQGFIRTFNNKVYKYTTSISKNIYTSKLANIVNEYNNVYQITNKMKDIDVKSNEYINIENNDGEPRFEVGDHVRISEYKKVENTVRWTYLIEKLNGEEVVVTFYENGLQKTNQTEFNAERVIKKEGDKRYVK